MQCEKQKDACSKAKQKQPSMEEVRDLHILLFMDWARITQDNKIEFNFNICAS